MKAIFLIKQDGVRGYIRSTKGWEFCDTVDNETEFYNKIEIWDDLNFFPNEDGTVSDQDGEEVFDPNYPSQFDFGDYWYRLIEVSELDDNQIRAVKNANPWNLDDIIQGVVLNNR